MSETNKTQAKEVKKSSPRKSESLNFRCEQFFGKNWKYIGSFIALALLVMAYEMSNINEKMTNLEKVVQENNGKVVLTTSDGRAIKVTKEPLKAEYLKQFALSTYVNNFIVSRSQLTNNFERPNFKNYTELLDNVPNLRLILNDFMDSKTDETKKIEANKIAVGDLRAYVQWLIAATAQDKLPEYIAIKDYSIDKYEYNANQYNMELSIKVVAQSYILSKNEYISQQGIFKIKSKGSFDLSKSSDINPYGMRIENLKIEPIVKNNQGV
ncbi:hypothetical protein ACYA4W_001149 [Campylobacter upsaliensis]